MTRRKLRYQPELSIGNPIALQGGSSSLAIRYELVGPRILVVDQRFHRAALRNTQKQRLQRSRTINFVEFSFVGPFSAMKDIPSWVTATPSTCHSCRINSARPFRYYGRSYNIISIILARLPMLEVSLSLDLQIPPKRPARLDVSLHLVDVLKLRQICNLVITQVYVVRTALTCFSSSKKDAI